MIFLKKYVAALAAILLLAYYLVLAWLLHRDGYVHSESLFLAEKTKLLFECRDGTLQTLGTTFPSLVFVSTILFSFLGYTFAPVVASATCSTLLLFVLIKDFEKSAVQQRIYLPALLLLFALHPGFIFTGVSGRGVAIVLLFFYLLFRSLFSYYKKQTTFALSMASIYLTCLIFCNYHFIWLLLAFIPFIVLISLEGMKQAKHGSPIIQYYESLNNRSQRRKLINRTFAIYVLLFILPLVSIYLFELLNGVHAGNSTYYLTSQYSSWKITGTETIGNIYLAKLENTNIKAQMQVFFQFYVLLLTPMLLLVFAIFKGKLYELLTLISPFIFLAVLLLDNQVYFTVEYYLIFVVLALVGLQYFVGKKYDAKKLAPIIMIAVIANVVTGIYYFKKSSDREEIAFFDGLKNASKKSDKVITEDYRMAKYISGLVGDKLNINNKIIMDDGAAYPIVAQLRKLDNIILPANVDFITVAENPKAGARYMCIAKNENRLKEFTILNAFNFKRYESLFTVKPTIMFETENWAVYKLNTHLQ